MREDEKTFHFARVTKMNDMFLDMNNTFAKRAKIESECAEKTCAKMCGSIYLAQGSHFLSQVSAKMLSCQPIEHGSRWELQNRQSCISFRKHVPMKMLLMSSWRPVAGATRPAVRIVVNLLFTRCPAQVEDATNGFFGDAVVAKSSSRFALEQFAKKAVFHCVIGALPFGQFHPPRKEFPPYRSCV